MYKCHACGRQFIGGARIEAEQIWNEFQKGKQTLLQLSFKYQCSKRTIQRKLDSHRISNPVKSPRNVIVLMDTTYWGRQFGVMLFKDSISQENLLKYYVKAETNALYQKGVEELKSKGFTINAIVCDGRRGLIQSFGEIPVQIVSISPSVHYKAIYNQKP